MKRKRWAAALVAAATVIVSSGGGPVRAAPSTPDDIYAALGIDRVVGDYVVMVDVSGSMNGDRYATVKRSLTAFFAALAPEDQVTLVPFADRAQARTQPAGRAPGQLVAKLPRVADGQHTDIGAAIEKTIDVLERPGAPALATVVLLTDGQHEPPAGSPYPFTQGYQWNQLARKAKELPQQSVTAYAIPLAGRTGAPLLKKAFPSARVLQPAAIDRLTAALEQPKAEARAAKARSLLAGDLTKGIQVAWPDDAIGAGHSEVAVTLTSTTAHVPLTVDRLAVTSTNPDLTVRAPATPVSLAPGKSATVPISVDWDAGPRRAAPLSTVRGTTTLALTGEVGSPWAATMTRDLRMTFRPALTGATTARDLSAQRCSIWYWIAGGVLLLALLALLRSWRARRLVPALTGSLRVRTPAGTEHHVALRGRKVRLTAGTSGLPGAGEVSAMRPSLGATRTDLVIQYSRDGSVAGRTVVTCAPGATVRAGGATFTWEGVPAPRGEQAVAP
ncbi:vWA domain-containing protein [Nucisporomicrobium flavum]|uniref:vWA domain-containing protein n=1 Tax=Nucisporomicrobium flavum TaxID=2785915 RepID=UPI003C2CFA1E